MIRQPNEHGVFSDHETLKLTGRKWEVGLHYVEGPGGWYSSFSLQIGGVNDGFGCGSFPGISDKAFKTREDAIFTARDEAWLHLNGTVKGPLPDDSAGRTIMLLTARAMQELQNLNIEEKPMKEPKEKPKTKVIKDEIRKTQITIPENVDPENHVVCRDTREYMFVEFSEKQLSEKSQELAHAIQNRQRIEREKQSVTSSFAARFKEADGTIERLSTQITSKGDMENVECVWKLNFPVSGRKTLAKKDTGEVIRETAMIPSDRQLVFDDLGLSEKTLDEKKVGDVDSTKDQSGPENHGSIGPEIDKDE